MTFGDKCIVVMACSWVVYSYVLFWTPTSVGSDVAIFVAGKAQQQLSLSDDQIVEITGVMGSSRIEIKSNQVRFIDSPCRGKQCIHSGWLREAGEFAACLPNKVSLHLQGLTEAYDAINY